MLQQTRVQTVIPYYLKFLASFPTLVDLARSDLQKVLKVWEGLGYYGRARNLHRAAQIVAERWDGTVPQDWHSFRSLPGVGDYIATAVLSIAFSKPCAVVDGNVKRVLSRLFTVDAPVNTSGADRIFRDLAAKLLAPRRPGTFNQALMELGALVCLPRNPGCRRCPLKNLCGAYGRGRVEQYPRRKAAKAIPLYRIATGVVCKRDRLLITQRKSEGLLGGLWEFPGGKVQEGETPQEGCVREIREETRLEVKVLEKLARVQHAYTHFRIEMDVFICTYLSGRVIRNGPAAHRWVRIQELDDYPFPKANLKFIPRLKERIGSRFPPKPRRGAPPAT
jgi:A/G-specific adenine glycosylase